jgi:hypothetical protein
VSVAVWYVPASNISYYQVAQRVYSWEMTSDNNFYTPPCVNSSAISIFPASITSEGFTNYFCTNH